MYNCLQEVVSKEVSGGYPTRCETSEEEVTLFINLPNYGHNTVGGNVQDV